MLKCFVIQKKKIIKKELMIPFLPFNLVVFTKYFLDIVEVLRSQC